MTYDDGIYDGFEEGNLGLISPEDGAFVSLSSPDAAGASAMLMHNIPFSWFNKLKMGRRSL